MSQIKLCGLRRIQDAQFANRAKPDFAGVVLTPGFRRSISPETAQELRQTLDSRIPLVGVFVDSPIATVVSFLRSGTIDIAQLHGQETPQTIQTIQQHTGKPVWKAFQIRTAADLVPVAACPADLVLLDAGKGSGMTFDWSLVQSVKRRYLLAGGLSADNIPHAIAQLHPFGVDVSSGAETDGWKDEAKMIGAVNAAHKMR